MSVAPAMAPTTSVRKWIARKNWLKHTQTVSKKAIYRYTPRSHGRIKLQSAQPTRIIASMNKKTPDDG